MNVVEMLAGLQYETISTAMTLEIQTVCNDSRLAKEGSCFIAIKGYRVDAHDLLEAVYEQGCRCFVLENREKAMAFTQMHQDALCLLVASTLESMAIIANNFYHSPSDKFEVVGITGTNGKTSIAQLLGGCLDASGKITGVLGTTGNKIAGTMYPTSNTTVESLKLQWLFNEMIRFDVDVCVMEVSSHALDLHRVDQTRFDIAVFTNLTEDHLDFHEDMEAYYQAKKKLFLMAQKACIINIDDAFGLRLYNELNQVRDHVYSYGINEASDYQAADINSWHDGSSFKLVTETFTLPVDIPIPGRIYVYNVLAVIGVLHQLGYDKADLSVVLKAIKPVPGRLEVVTNNIGATIVVDYAHTPDALEKVIKVCREFTDGDLYVIFGCGGDRDRTKRPLMGKIAAEGANHVIVTNDNPRTEEPDSIIDAIIEGIPKDKLGHVRAISDRREAINAGVAALKAKDTLLIAGKGHENYQIIGETKHHFDDREEAAKALLYRA